MGFKFRKSVKMGPVRVNLSKSGVGYSVGGKGMRVTKKAGGGVKTTVGIPGTGISYSTDSKKKSTTKKTASSKTTARENATPASDSPGCLGVIAAIILLCILIGFIKAYWKIILGLGLFLIAVLIGLRILKKKIETEETADLIEDAGATE